MRLDQLLRDFLEGVDAIISYTRTATGAYVGDRKGRRIFITNKDLGWLPQNIEEDMDIFDVSTLVNEPILPPCA